MVAKAVARFQWNLSEFEKLRRGSGIRDVIDEVTEQVADRANDQALVPGAKYGWKSRQDRSRFQGIVFTDNFAARRDQAKFSTLEKAL